MAASKGGEENDKITSKIYGEDSNEEEWIKVQRKKAHSNNNSSGDGYESHASGNNDQNPNPKPKKTLLERMSMSFFITNFPHYVSNKDLWNKCASWGSVCDVYIANRLSKAGKRFAFVRFIKVSDANKLLSDLKTMWIAKYKLFVDVVKFNRSFKNRVTARVIGPKENMKNVTESNTANGKSYAEALSGNKDNAAKGEKASNITRRIVKVQTLSESSSDDTLSIIAKLNDPASIPYVKRWLYSEGYIDLNVHYVGGRWVVLKFNSVEARDLLLSNESLKSKFVAIKSVSDLFVPDERLVWVDIHGLPKGIWNRQAILNITDKWGNGIFFDCDWNSGNSVAKVCLLSHSKSIIFEELTVVFEDKEFVIWLKEFAPWEPTILQPNCVKSGSENSDGETDFDDYLGSSVKDSPSDDCDSMSSNKENGRSEDYDSRLCRDNSGIKEANSGNEPTENSFFHNTISSPESNPDLPPSIDEKQDGNNNIISEEDSKERKGDMVDGISITGCKIPPDASPVVSPGPINNSKSSDQSVEVEAIPTKDPDDIFSLDEIIRKELNQKKVQVSPTPKNHSLIDSDSSGAPGYIRGVYPQPTDFFAYGNHGDNKLAKENGHSPFIMETTTAANTFDILEVGKGMGFEIQNETRSFGDLLSRTSAEKVIQ